MSAVFRDVFAFYPKSACQVQNDRICQGSGTLGLPGPETSRHCDAPFPCLECHNPPFPVQKELCSYYLVTHLSLLRVVFFFPLNIALSASLLLAPINGNANTGYERELFAQGGTSAARALTRHKQLPKIKLQAQPLSLSLSRSKKKKKKESL